MFERQLHQVNLADDKLAIGNVAASIALKMALGESINTPRGKRNCCPTSSLLKTLVLTDL